MKIILLLFGTLFLSTCSKSKNQMDISAVMGKELKVISLNDKTIENQKLTMTIAVDEGMVNGFSGCNRYFGEYSLEGKTIRFSNIGKTKMYCESTMKIETSFLKALENCTFFEISKDGDIQLFNGNKSLLITLSV